jgi:hypothetical protein
VYLVRATVLMQPYLRNKEWCFLNKKIIKQRKQQYCLTGSSRYNLPGTNVIIRVTSKQSLPITRPCQAKAVWWACVQAWKLRDHLRAQFIYQQFSFQVLDEGGKKEKNQTFTVTASVKCYGSSLCFNGAYTENAVILYYWGEGGGDRENR